MPLRFDWDDQKAYTNLHKHGVSFEEASTVFYDDRASVSIDEEHSADEQRFKIIGLSGQHRLIVVSFVERCDMIRIISGRKATPKERRGYEESQKEI